MRSKLNSPWTLVVIGLLVFYVLLYLLLDLPASLKDTPAIDPIRTLLGALATGLITAQALVFTISLVAAQLNSRYTHRIVSRIFTWPTALYMGLFIGSSIYSMVVLAALSSRSSDFVLHVPIIKPVHPVTIAIALAGTCLALLVPYLWSFKKRLDPERMAQEQGERASKHLRRGLAVEPLEVAALDNIIMSAYGYKDYDTFGTGLQVLSGVAIDSWRLSKNVVGQSVIRRIAHIGMATVDDPRAPIQVVDALASSARILAGERRHEAARLVAATMSDLAEVALDRSHPSPAILAAVSLSELGRQASELGLVATAEEVAYSLGHLGSKTSQLGLVDATRQVASYLRIVGTRAAEHKLDLVVRQALISLWTLGAQTRLHLPQLLDIVAGELELLERVADPELADGSYLSAPRSEALEEFRVQYLSTIKPNSAPDS